MVQKFSQGSVTAFAMSLPKKAASPFNYAKVPFFKKLFEEPKFSLL